MKKYFPLVCILLHFSSMHAQSSNWQWAKSAGSSLSDTPHDIETSADGSIYTTGFFSGQHIAFGTTSLSNNAPENSDMYFIRYDAQGNIIWAKSAGGTDDDSGKSLATDSEGNCYIAGSFSSSAFTLEGVTLSATSGSRDVFVAKYTASGILLWATKIGGTGDEAVASISTYRDNSLFITGTYKSPSLDLNGIILSSDGDEDIFTAKLNSSGQVLWAKSFGGDYTDYVNNSATDVQGNSFITGYSFNPETIFGSDTLVNTYGSDAYILKLDEEGNVVWVKSGSGNEYFGVWGHGIDTDTMGNCYVAGSFSSDSAVFDHIVLTNSAPHAADIFLMKYSPEGDILWAKSPSGNIGERVEDLETDDQGNIYLVGQFTSSMLSLGNNIHLSSTGQMDVFVAKYDKDGNIVWAQTAGGDGLDLGIGLAVDDVGDCYVTGGFNGHMISVGADTFLNHEVYSWDIFTAKIGGTSSLASVPETPEINIFPNPLKQEATIRSPYVIDRLTVTNLEGKIVYAVHPNTQEHIFRLEQAGFYFITLLTGGYTISQKIAVVR